MSITKKDIGKIVYRLPGAWPDRVEGKFTKLMNGQVYLDEKVSGWLLKGFGEWFVKEEKSKKGEAKLNKFYILWNPEGSMPPTVKFGSLKQARVVAEKMMERIGTGSMYVMESVEACTNVQPKFVWEKTKKVIA